MFAIWGEVYSILSRFLIDIKEIYMKMHSEKLFLCGKCVSYSCHRPCFLIIRYTCRKNIWINLFINIFQVCRIFMKKDCLHVERNRFNQITQSLSIEEVQPAHRAQNHALHWHRSIL